MALQESLAERVLRARRMEYAKINAALLRFIKQGKKITAQLLETHLAEANERTKMGLEAPGPFFQAYHHGLHTLVSALEEPTMELLMKDIFREPDWETRQLMIKNIGIMQDRSRESRTKVC